MSEPDRELGREFDHRSDRESGREFDRDVVIVGGGASGLSAAVFLARYGLDALVFDRGNSAIKRCYSLENYLGFLGIRPETYLELARDHARYEGADIEDDMVVGVTRVENHEDGENDSTSETGFQVRTQDGREVTTRHVLAATAYDGDYLAPLADGNFHDEGDHPVEADEEGRTEVDGLYVAGWLSGGPHQVVVAAGHGARVAKSLIEDRRKERGYWEGVAEYWDWRVSEGRYGSEEWEREVDEWIDGTIPDDAEFGAERVERVRGEIKAERLAFQQSETERARRLEAGRERLRKRLFEDDAE
jgi:NADPH-dependent 2,4-dienoyl-CoA reductase/sulfur reductase-like enzyme